jgi:glucosamine kinase
VIQVSRLPGALILGVDGGGSTTRVAIADQDGRVLAMSLGAGVNPMDNERWQTNLRESVAPLSRYMDRVGQACLALPAYGESRSVTERQQTFVTSLLPHTAVRLVNDVKAAHAGAFAGTTPGILLLAGTGSMVWGLDASGNDIRVGGWGHVLSDEGSAYWVGREALSAVCKIVDGRIEGGEFFKAITAQLGLASALSMDAVLSWYSQLEQPRADVAALSRTVDELAECGDPEAIAVLARAADELAALVRSAWGRTGTRETRWTYAGGLFDSRRIRRELEDRLGKPAEPVLPPIGGSLLLAAEAAEVPTSPLFVDRLAETLHDRLHHHPTGDRDTVAENGVS